MPDEQYYEHFFVGDHDFTHLSETDINQLQRELFSTAPIPFHPRKGVEVEANLKILLEQYRVGLPIIWIRDTLYLVGDKKIHIKQDTRYIIANVGGGYEEFWAWFSKHIEDMERSLITKMVNSRESLETVCQKLIDGQPIRHHAITPELESSRKKMKKNDINGFGIERRVMKAPGTDNRSPTRGSPSRKSFGGTSPLRRPSTSPLGGRKSPINRSSTPKKSAGKTRTPTSWSKDIQAQIEKLMAKYDIKRREYQRDLDYTLMEREEHAKQGDQTLADKNRGRYAYVHNKV